MATFILKYTYTHERCIIIESSDEETAKLLDQEGSGNTIKQEWGESDEQRTVTQIDEITYKDVN